MSTGLHLLSGPQGSLLSKHLKGRWGPHVGIANLLETNLKTIFFILLYLTVALILFAR